MKMACSVVRSPILRNATVRHYAAATTAQACATTGVEYQQLNNNLSIAALDNNNPVSQVSVIFRAGPRNETYHTQGVSHHLRIAAGLATCNSSYFGITRNIQQLGGNITVTNDRESIAYTLQVTRNNLDQALSFLGDVSTQQLFKPWELSDQMPRLRYELSKIPETARLIELLHKAAYCSGLGYSLYSPKRQVGKISSETLQHFVNTWFTSSRCAVVGTGVQLSQLSEFASCLNLHSSECSDQPARYYGGELRKERTSSVASVALAVEAAGLNKEKDVLAYAVLQRAAGVGPHVKWGSSGSPLYTCMSGVAGQHSFAVSAFNAAYTDSGLFGIVLCSEPSIAGSLTECAYKWLKSPNVTDNDISRGKNALKAEILYNGERDAGLLEIIGHQALYKGQVCTAMELAECVNNVTEADVKRVIGNLTSGKLTLAAIGDLCSVPNQKELC